MSANGVYAYSPVSTFPTSTLNATNYGVDVLFQPTAPGQVTGVSATAGHVSAVVTWSPPAGGGATRYVVTPYIGATAQTPTTVSGSPPATTTTITGLQQGTAYTFTVQAANANGSGPVSAQSNSVTPVAPAAPDAPTAVSADPASGQAVVHWTTPNANGSPITGYTVTPFIGLTAQTPVQVTNGSASSTTVTALTNGTSYTFNVAATNAIGTGPASTSSSGVTPDNTIFDFATPSTVDSGDTAAAVLGVKFTADTSGKITGIRFYKASTNTGTHIGTLWTASGQQLASATFTSESASGWQTVLFSTPVSVNASTTYVASYFAPNGHYSYNPSALNAAIDNPPLHSVANSISADGVYAISTSNTFPSSSFNAANYWVDVLFDRTAPGQPTGVAATADFNSAKVTWSAPATGGVSAYTVTPYIGATAQAPTQINDGSATSATIAGLASGTAYTFTVQASNGSGSGPASAPSNAVTPLAPSAPDAPTSVSASPATGQASVHWTAPAANGSPITGYTITPFIGSSAQTSMQVANGSATSATVTGLTNGTSYTFRVSATNGVGTGAGSAASSTVTPEDTIFDFAGPANPDSGDNSSAEASASSSRLRRTATSSASGSTRLWRTPEPTSAASGPPAASALARLRSQAKQHQGGRRSCSRAPSRSAPEQRTLPATSTLTATTRTRRHSSVRPSTARRYTRSPTAPAVTACTRSAPPAPSRRTASTPRTTGSTSSWRRAPEVTMPTRLKRSQSGIRLSAVTSIVAVSLAALTACGGSSTRTTTTTKEAHATPAQSNADIGAASGQTPAAGNFGHRRSSEGTIRAQTPPHAPRVQQARQTPGSTNDEKSPSGARQLNPCQLVSVHEAESITGGMIVNRVEAPLGPTCIYTLSTSKAPITMAVQSQSFSQVTRNLAKRQSVKLRGHQAYCGNLGAQMLWVSLGKGKLLHVTAPCSVAQRFAALALNRLAA